MSGNPGEGALKWDARLNPLVFLQRFRTSLSHDRLQPIDQLNAARWSVELHGHAPIEILRIFPHSLNARMYGKDRLGMLGSKVSAPTGGPSLPHHGPALR